MADRVGGSGISKKRCHDFFFGHRLSERFNATCGNRCVDDDAYPVVIM
jgi:hypothetical protein